MFEVCVFHRLKGRFCELIENNRKVPFWKIPGTFWTIPVKTGVTCEGLNFVQYGGPVFEILAFLCFAIFAQKFENSKWPPFLARQIFFENWHGYSAEIPCRSKISSKSLYLAGFSRYKHFYVLQFLRKIRKFKMAAIFGETKFF